MTRMHAPRRRQNGFTLIELVIVITVVGILMALAIPSYTRYLVRASRQSMQADLVQMANVQEKIYLNSNAYTGSVTNPYDGTSTGGLGRTGTSVDGMYTYTVTPNTPSQSYTLTATPVVGTRQAKDGTLTLSSNGVRTWGTATW